jgi:hypothetical protein
MGDFSLGFIEAIASRNGSPIYLDENAIAPIHLAVQASVLCFSTGKNLQYK